MKMRLLFGLILTMSASFVLRGQDSSYAVLNFKEQTYWLSNVHEGDVAEHKFRFVNSGNSPLVVSEVIQSEFSPRVDLKEPIAPGDSGFVLLSFATAGKSGYFDRTITIKSNNRDGDVVLHLRGQIIPKPDPNAPIMSFEETSYWFDTVYQGSTVDHEFRFTNKGKTPLIISNVCGSSGCIVPSYPKEPIAPGQSNFVRVVFNSTGKMGPQDKSVTVTSNASEPQIVLHIKGVVISAAPPAPVDRSGPILKFDSPVFTFDTAQYGDTITHEFRFTNTGRSPLIIHEVLGNGGGAIASYSKEPIAPGGTGVISISFITMGRQGFHDKSFIVTSNSPEITQYIHLKGTIVAFK